MTLRLPTLLGRRNQMVVFTAVIAVALAIAIMLAGQILTRLSDLGTTGKDNLQWTMAQLEVEQLNLTHALERLEREGETALPDLRRWFDSYYSRLDTLKSAPTYRDALAGTSGEVLLNRLWDTMQTAAAIVDSSNAEVMRRLPELQRLIVDQTRDIRLLSIAGIEIYAQRSERELDGLSMILGQLAVITLLLVVGLVSLVALLWTLYRRYAHRARSNRVTLRRLATILDTSQDAILVIAADGRISQWNAAASRLFGLPPAPDATEADETSLDPTPDARLETLLSCAGPSAHEDGTGPFGALCASGPDDQSAPHHALTACDLFTASETAPLRAQRITGHSPTRSFPAEIDAEIASQEGDRVCVCFVKDITERLAAEAEAEAARERALAGEQAKARFLGVISHEMRTPLNGVLGTLDLLENTDLDPEQKEMAEVMQTSGQILLSQIQNALQITQTDTLTLDLVDGPFDLGLLLDDLIRSLTPIAAAQGTRLDLLPASESLNHCLGDQGRLRQILLNLLANAIKYTSEGVVSLDAARLPDPSGAASPIVEFQVMDTGRGIAEADLPRIFDDFVRVGAPAQKTGTLIEGSGLGLAIVRDLVEGMGGTIGVESEEGQGSLFWVRLPLPEAPATVPRPAKQPAAPPAPPMDILIAEDNRINRFVLRTMLEKDGHRVVETTDGRAATRAAQDRLFDVILMDVNMPMMDGLEASRSLREESGPNRHTPILALTAYLDPDTGDSRWAAARFDGVITKPLRLDTLRRALNDPSAFEDGAEGHRLPVIDTTTALLGDARTANDSARRLIGEFLDEGRAFAQDLGGLRALPPEEAARRVHHLAGTAAVTGARALQRHLSFGEGAYIAGNVEQIARFETMFPALWQETETAFTESFAQS